MFKCSPTKIFNMQHDCKTLNLIGWLDLCAGGAMLKITLCHRTPCTNKNDWSAICPALTGATKREGDVNHIIYPPTLSLYSNQCEVKSPVGQGSGWKSCIFCSSYLAYLKSTLHLFYIFYFIFLLSDLETLLGGRGTILGQIIEANCKVANSG